MIQIKSRITGNVLIEINADSLIGANLRGLHLEGANLEGANIEGASLYETGLYQFVGGGSIGRCITYNSINDTIIAGCFYDSLENFKKAVSQKYGNEHEYISFINMCEKHFKR